MFEQRNCYNNMGDINIPKLQLRPSLPTSGDKSTSPATKLLINHGKPNFTIQRSTKTENGNINPTSHASDASCRMQTSNNKFVVKSTTFNGVFKPSNMSFDVKQTLQENGSVTIKNGSENEATKVVLRRPKIVQTQTKERKGDENVPEFILRQRRIQERLANQNILDFENRRSGYFTQVLISPSSPNRQSFVETMASPAVKPGLEIPPLMPLATQHENIKEETILKEQEYEYRLQSETEKSEEVAHEESGIINGQIEEEEVARAIEEVNKAVEGEDDDKIEVEEQAKTHQVEAEQNLEVAKSAEDTNEKDITVLVESHIEETPATTDDVITRAEVTKEQVLEQNDNVKLISSSIAENIEKETFLNGLSKQEAKENTVTISHTNGLNAPTIPSPDRKGEKGVNFESKTVVSFSQELGNGDNKYPDTVKMVKDAGDSEFDSEWKELTKLKFEIKGDEQIIEVKPILITETS